MGVGIQSRNRLKSRQVSRNQERYTYIRFHLVDHDKLANASETTLINVITTTIISQ